MTIDEAYIAMFGFLNQFYEETHSSDVGALLGEMNLIEPRVTVDPAAWDSWEKAVSAAPSVWENFLKSLGRQREDRGTVLLS